MKIEIDVDIPEGYEFVRFDKLENGDRYVKGNGEIGFWGPLNCSSERYVIVRSVEKWRVPTKLDLLNRDEIECRVRQDDLAEWIPSNVSAVRTGYHNKFATITGWWRYCEIRDTEPKPRECWCRFGEDHLGVKYLCGVKQEKPNSEDLKEYGFVHFVEVPE